VLTPQPFDLTALSLDLALLPRELVDQIFARSGAPSREHAAVMARLLTLYKYDYLD
jgi:hypothetical protein